MGAISFTALTGDVIALRLEMADAECQLSLPQSCCAIDREVLGLVTAGAHQKGCAGLTFGRPGHDVNDACDGIAAPNGTFCPVHNFNALDLLHRKLAEIKFATLADIVGLDAVNEHKDVIGFSAAHSNLGQAAQAALLAYAQTRLAAE